jgi:hypothetical protein
LDYDNKLQDGSAVQNRSPVQNKLQPLLVVNLIKTKMKFNWLHQSYENLGETMVVNVLYDFLRSSEFQNALPTDVGHLSADDIYILTPYNRHKDRLRMLVCDIEK